MPEVRTGSGASSEPANTADPLPADSPPPTLRAPGVRTKGPATLSPSSGAQVAEAIADLGVRLSVASDAIAIGHSRAATWTDASLGCPGPGASYPRQLIKGSLLVLVADGEEYEYHGGSSGELFYCATPVAPAEPLD